MQQPSTFLQELPYIVQLTGQMLNNLHADYYVDHPVPKRQRPNIGLDKAWWVA